MVVRKYAVWDDEKQGIKYLEMEEYEFHERYVMTQMKDCPICGTDLTGNDTKRTRAEFNEAMEWYFNRDDTPEWAEFQEWKKEKQAD